MKSRLDIRLATRSDRDQIYRIRHRVYAEELGQHPCNAEGILMDALDRVNEYIVVRDSGRVIAFVSITPPGAESFSIDKYFSRPELPLEFHDRLYELRLLTVIDSRRNTRVLPMLTRAAFDYLRAKGAVETVAIGRREVLPMYERMGFERLGFTTKSGKVIYELMRLDLAIFERKSKIVFSDRFSVDRSGPTANDSLYKNAYHGGAFFEAIGNRLDTIDRKDHVISADVLDAWFDPAPEVSETISQYLPWEIKTSPPTHAEGVLEILSQSRGIEDRHFVVGAGSSDLMFRAIPQWVNKYSRVLILDPTYGEYAHILCNVIGCEVNRFPLSGDDGFSIDMDSMSSAFSSGYDWIFLVNPNSPTGTMLSRDDFALLLRVRHPKTHVWVDETYIDYVDSSMTLESLAANEDRMIICKSLSKCYALSGLRAAYLCGAVDMIAQIRHITPPWVLGLPTQIAVICALRNKKYYEEMWTETRKLKEELAIEIREIGIDILSSEANFLLCRIRDQLIAARKIIEQCRLKNLYLRDLSGLGNQLDEYTFRISVKDEKTNRKMVNIISEEMAAVRLNPIVCD